MDVDHHCCWKFDVLSHFLEVLVVCFYNFVCPLHLEFLTNLIASAKFLYSDDDLEFSFRLISGGDHPKLVSTPRSLKLDCHYSPDFMHLFIPFTTNVAAEYFLNSLCAHKLPLL